MESNSVTAMNVISVIVLKPKGMRPVVIAVKWLSVQSWQVFINLLPRQLKTLKTSIKTDCMLSDKNIRPTDEDIFSIIKDKKPLWDTIMLYLRNNYPSSSGEWNYYNDGKKWLFKMLNKKKTLFWIGMLENTFRVTFWFGDKAETHILSGMLPQKIKDEFINAKKYGAIRAISVIIDDSSDVDIVLSLLDIKFRLK
jgi:hypothetical protein